MMDAQDVTNTERVLPGKPVGPTATILRGLIRHCPRCGSGKLFRRYFLMAERCPSCNVKFARDEGFFLGAYTMNLGFILLASALVIFFGFALREPGGSIRPMMIAGGLTTLVLPPLLYPFSKTLWCAVDLTMQRALGKAKRN
jgi:uncharacterized protein (DUF983 family)